MASYSLTTTSSSLGTPTAPTRVTNSGPDAIEVTQGDRTVMLYPTAGSEVFPAGTEITAVTLRSTATAVTTDATESTLTLTGGHLAVTGPAVTAAADTGAGTTPPAPVVTGATDIAGTITFGTGTSSGAGDLVAVTFGRAFAAAPDVIVIANNTATEDLGIYVAASTTGFVVSSTGAPTDSQANTVYSISYHCIA